MPKRQGNDPKRRIIPRNDVDPGILDRLEREARYTGSPLHKRRPSNYGFQPPASPHPGKSLCDRNRSIRLAEARKLFQEGVRLGMVSEYREDNGLPKYVWAVDSDERAYEAKIGGDGRSYHGYELYNDEAMQRWVVEEWTKRCPMN